MIESREGENRFKLKIHLEHGGKKALGLRTNKVTKWMLNSHRNTPERKNKST